MLKSDSGEIRAHIDGGNGNAYLGGGGAGGDLTLRNSDGESTVHLDGNVANLQMGGGGASGDISLLSGTQEQTLFLDGGDGNMRVGGGGSNGDIALFSDDGKMRMHIDGGRANIYAGGEGAAGDIALKNDDGETVIHLDAGDGVIRIKGNHVQTADHVFSSTYDLVSLTEVEAFIGANGHLPGIDSAADMRRDGVDLNAMNAKLLEKIEELTLHIIEQDKRIAALEARRAH
ncbi:MAG: hypothetical protein AAFO51_04995 [Pseudomonadota bacterium]